MQAQLNRRRVVRETRHRLPASERRFRASLGRQWGWGCSAWCCRGRNQPGNVRGAQAGTSADPLKDEAGRNVSNRANPSAPAIPGRRLSRLRFHRQ